MKRARDSIISIYEPNGLCCIFLVFVVFANNFLLINGRETCLFRLIEEWMRGDDGGVVCNMSINLSLSLYGYVCTCIGK
jgi:hypothetical protein